MYQTNNRESVPLNVLAFLDTSRAFWIMIYSKKGHKPVWKYVIWKLRHIFDNVRCVFAGRLVDMERCYLSEFSMYSTEWGYLLWCVVHMQCRMVMMTSSNGNIFRVTGHLCGEFTGPQWIPCTKASDAELWCFLWSAPEYTVKQTIEAHGIWDAIVLIMTSLQWYNSGQPHWLWVYLLQGQWCNPVGYGQMFPNNALGSDNIVKTKQSKLYAYYFIVYTVNYITIWGPFY